MINSIDEKICRFQLDLDYPIYKVNLETQTNLLINKTINEFINTYEKDFNSKTFIYEFNDDLIGLIGYNILLCIQSIKPEFKFYLYGFRNRTKKYLSTKDFYSYRKVKKIKEDVILISSDNPIYKVVSIKSKSKILRRGKKNLSFIDAPKFHLMRKFTFNEILTAQIFYHIGYIKDSVESSNIKLTSYQRWVDSKLNTFYTNTRPQTTYDKFFNEKFNVGAQKLVYVYLNGEVDSINALLQEVEQSNSIVLYFGNWNLLLEDTGFNFLLRRGENRPNPDEFNNYNLASSFYCAGAQVDFIGEWPTDKLNLIMED